MSPRTLHAMSGVVGLAVALLADEGVPLLGGIPDSQRLHLVRDCGMVRDAIDTIRPAERRWWAEQVTASSERITTAREILALAQHRDPRVVSVGLGQIADRIAP